MILDTLLYFGMCLFITVAIVAVFMAGCVFIIESIEYIKTRGRY